MNQKLPALALAVTLTGALSIGALAGEPERLISPKPTACAGAITVNGQALDTAGVPAVSGQGLLPMRLVAESDHGSAAWYEEENTGAFYLDGNVISVDFATGSVTVNDTAAEGVTARVVQGVTFLPAALLEGLEGYTVEAADPQQRAAGEAGLSDHGCVGHGLRHEDRRAGDGRDLRPARRRL